MCRLIKWCHLQFKWLCTWYYKQIPSISILHRVKFISQTDLCDTRSFHRKCTKVYKCTVNHGAFSQKTENYLSLRFFSILALAHGHPLHGIPENVSYLFDFVHFFMIMENNMIGRMEVTPLQEIPVNVSCFFLSNLKWVRKQWWQEK